MTALTGGGIRYAIEISQNHGMGPIEVSDVVTVRDGGPVGWQNPRIMTLQE